MELILGGGGGGTFRPLLLSPLHSLSGFCGKAEGRGERERERERKSESAPEPHAGARAFSSAVANKGRNTVTSDKGSRGLTPGKSIRLD